MTTDPKGRSDASNRPPLAPLPPDTHEAQAARVADHCGAHPGQPFTLAELASACDLACASKVLSAMSKEMGYGLAKGWRSEACADATRARSVRTYRVTHRPRGDQMPLTFA